MKPGRRVVVAEFGEDPVEALNDSSIRAPRLDQIMKWVEEGRLHPYISHVFPLADFKEAMRAQWRGDVVGGCVLHP